MFEGSLKNVFPDSSNVEKLTLLTKKRSEERFLNKSECLSYLTSVPVRVLVWPLRRMRTTFLMP